MLDGRLDIRRSMINHPRNRPIINGFAPPHVGATLGSRRALAPLTDREIAGVSRATSRGMKSQSSAFQVRRRTWLT